MDRMSPLDATFLNVEDDVTHMHIASCAIFEGPAPAYADLVALFESKLGLVPRYRHKVRFVPGGIARPVWVDDPHFRIEYHVRHTALPPPGNAVDLRNLMGRLMSQQLDRNRPLWETWVVEGLADGTWALISKVHHCMVDGVSGTDLMAVILDTQRKPNATAVTEWRPQPEPTDTEMLRSAIADAMVSPYELVRWARARTHGPRKLASDVGVFLTGAKALGGRLRPNTPLSIEGNIGPHRRWVWARTSLADVKEVRSALGGTVNDVVLAAITKGFRDLLLSRGDVIDGAVVRSLIPVSVRSGDDHSLNNQVSAMIAELPVGIADPVERLQAVCAQMQSLKESHQSDAGVTISELVGFAPPALLTIGVRAATAVLRRLPQRSINTVTTNVPGPQIPLYACGREMLEYFPFVPLSQGVQTGVAILSYNGKVAFGITGDWDASPDIDVLANGIEAGVDELLKLARRAKRRRRAA